MKTEYKERRAAKHDADRLKKALVMGKPNSCFENATRAVLKFPERLLYVEGFVLSADKDSFTHHAWVKDKLTGGRHEITPSINEADHVYIGKEFTKDEMVIFRGQAELEEPMHPDNFNLTWAYPGDTFPQLTKADELELLTGAGYDLELLAVLNDWKEVEVVNPANIDMSHIGADYELQVAKGTEDEPAEWTREGGQQNWHYEWRIKEPALQANAAAGK
jgi:hypothetical protein